MSRILSQFEERMLDNNTRILSRVLDLIAETEGDDQLHLDMLATHLAKETSEVIDVIEWPGDYEEYGEVTQLSDFMHQTGCGSERGVCPWNYADGRRTQDDKITEFLRSLEEAVRINASTELLGTTTAESLELLADYCEFLRHTDGVVYENLDREMFVCNFGSTFPPPDRQAQPLDKMCKYVSTRAFEVAAGWKAGDNDKNCWAFYLLCKDKDLDEPWQWRIFVTNIEAQDTRRF